MVFRSGQRLLRLLRLSLAAYIQAQVGGVGHGLHRPADAKQLLTAQSQHLYSQHQQPLFQLNEFIMNGLPKYDSRFELPAKFEADPGKYEALEFKLCLKDSIVCFE